MLDLEERGCNLLALSLLCILLVWALSFLDEDFVIDVLDVE